MQVITSNEGVVFRNRVRAWLVGEPRLMDARLRQLPVYWQRVFDVYFAKDYIAPAAGGEWSGRQRESRWRPYADTLPMKNAKGDRNYNPEGKTLRQLMMQFGGQDYVEFSPLQEVDFEPFAAYKVVHDRPIPEMGWIEDDVRNLWQAETRQILAERWHCDLNGVTERLNREHLTLHECCDGKTVLCVPYVIHESISHYGGVATVMQLAQLGIPTVAECQEMCRRLGIR